MGFNPPVPQQDSNWEIRVAVQASLLLQVFLIFVGPMRKRSSHPFPRFTVWSCYLLADWVADLALGLMLNNMGNIGGGGGGASGSFGSPPINKRGGGGGATAGNPNPNNSSSSSSSNNSSPIIFAFWTPFLLLHLGGPDTITAYSLEDNELWLRHLIGLLFELFSACVIFFCSLHGNPMIHATVLMFVAGIIKYGERTYSLYSGSVDGFRTKILDPPEPGPNYAKLMTEFDSKEKAGVDVQIIIADGEASKAQKQMQEEETTRLVGRHKSVEARAYDFFVIFRRLFVNLILSFKERRLSQAFFLERQDVSPREAFDVIEVELNFIYDMVYTKAPVAHKKAGWVLRSVCSACLVASLVIFFVLDKPGHGIERVDVGITYALLLGGLALDAAALLMLLLSNRATVFLEGTPWLQWLANLTRKVKGLRRRTRRWSRKTSQLNLIDYCLGKLGHRYSSRGRSWSLIRIADALDVDDFLYIQRMPVPSTPVDSNDHNNLLGFIFKRIKEAAQNLEVNKEETATQNEKPKEESPDQKQLKNQKEEMMKVCNMRGNGVVCRLKKEITADLKLDDDKSKKELFQLLILHSAVKEEEESMLLKDKLFELILHSVKDKDFDESLLLWHVATDLCLLPEKKEQEGPETHGVFWRPGVAKTLSEYMLYLLIKQPDMLSTTAGIGLLRYRDTCEEARRFLGSMEVWLTGDPHDARKMLLSVNTSRAPAEVKGDRSKSVLFDAVILAKALMSIDMDIRWEVITGVWGEMLTYAAGKCRGSTHVRQLSRGGELITLVWFLMAHMGLGDMYQIQEGDAKAKLVVKGQ